MDDITTEEEVSPPRRNKLHFTQLEHTPDGVLLPEGISAPKPEPQFELLRRTNKRIVKRRLPSGLVVEETQLLSDCEGINVDGAVSPPPKKERAPVEGSGRVISLLTPPVHASPDLLDMFNQIPEAPRCAPGDDPIMASIPLNCEGRDQAHLEPKPKKVQRRKAPAKAPASAKPRAKPVCKKLMCVPIA